MKFAFIITLCYNILVFHSYGESGKCYFKKGCIVTERYYLYSIISVLAIIVLILLIRLIHFKKKNYLPNIGEVYKNKIQLNPEDNVYNNHRDQEPAGKVGNFFDVQLRDPTVTISVPFDAISKNGRFLIITSSNQSFWVKPSYLKRRYSIKIGRKKSMKMVMKNLFKVKSKK